LLVTSDFKLKLCFLQVQLFSQETKYIDVFWLLGDEFFESGFGFGTLKFAPQTVLSVANFNEVVFHVDFADIAYNVFSRVALMQTYAVVTLRSVLFSQQELLGPFKHEWGHDERLVFLLRHFLIFTKLTLIQK